MTDYDDRPDRSEFAEEDFANEVRSYPRGFGPPWRGDGAPSEYGDPHYVDDEQSPDPDRFILDPGFPEED